MRRVDLQRRCFLQTFFRLIASLRFFDLVEVHWKISSNQKYLTSGNSRKQQQPPRKHKTIDLDRKKSEPSANPTSACLYLRRRRRDSVFSNPTPRPSARNAPSSPVLREKKRKKVCLFSRGVIRPDWVIFHLDSFIKARRISSKYLRGV